MYYLIVNIHRHGSMTKPCVFKVLLTEIIRAILPQADGHDSYFGYKIQPFVNINFNHKRLLSFHYFVTSNDLMGLSLILK
jgi:hypothetical protein